MRDTPKDICPQDSKSKQSEMFDPPPRIFETHRAVPQRKAGGEEDGKDLFDV